MNDVQLQQYNRHTARSALRELRHAKKELTQAYECDVDDFDEIIEDLELKLKGLEQRR